MKKVAEEWFRVRWEFMRRDPEYVKAFERIRKIEEQNSEDKKILIDELRKTFQEFDLNIPWDGINLPRLPDPNRSFDELTAHHSAMALFGYCFSSGAITIHWFKDRGLPHDGLVLDIDFNKVNSIEALRQSVDAIIEYHWNSWYLPRHPKRERRNKTDFDIIIKIGDLKKGNPEATYRELAEKVFPQEMDYESPNASPESAIKKTEQHYKRYQKLTEGGWRSLKFP
jgi:hypothetical protein